MSKLYEKYLLLKNKNPSQMYLFKSGIFYIFLADDAKKASSLLNLKLSYLNESVFKCGFPVNSLDKYLSLLENMNCKLEIVNSTNTLLPPKKNTEIFDYLTKMSKVDLNNLSISEVYNFLEGMSKEANILLKELSINE